MDPLVARATGIKIKEGDPEKNPLGTLTITVECRATEANILAYNRLRNIEVILEPLQPEMWEKQQKEAEAKP